MAKNNETTRLARQAALEAFLELLLATIGDTLLSIEEKQFWTAEFPTFESLLREYFDQEADWYLKSLAGAKVRRHLHTVGAAKLDSLRHDYAVELSKLPPELQITAWVAVITSGSLDIGTVKIVVERLLKGASISKPAPKPKKTGERDEP